MKMKRTLAVLTTLIMILSLFPLQALAEDWGNEIEIVKEEEAKVIVEGNVKANFYYYLRDGKNTGAVTDTNIPANTYAILARFIPQNGYELDNTKEITTSGDTIIIAKKQESGVWYEIQISSVADVTINVPTVKTQCSVQFSLGGGDEEKFADRNVRDRMKSTTLSITSGAVTVADAIEKIKNIDVGLTDENLEKEFEGWKLESGKLEGRQTGDVFTVDELAEMSILLLDDLKFVSVWKDKTLEGEMLEKYEVDLSDPELENGTIVSVENAGGKYYNIWYTAPDGKRENVAHLKNGATVTVTQSGGETTNSYVSVKSNVKSLKLVIDSVDIESARGAVEIGSGSEVEMTLKGQSTLKGGYQYAAVNVFGEAKLTILGTKEDSLTAIGGDAGAGIGGGGKGQDAADSKIDPGTRTICIMGGTIEAKGNQGGAGIGTSAEYGSSPSSTSVIVIGGNAVVTAKGAASSAGGTGIGGGQYSNVDRITIQDDAVVVATGGSDAAGIGGGSGAKDREASFKTITIKDRADVTAVGGVRAAGIGGGGKNNNFLTTEGGTIEIEKGTTIKAFAPGSVDQASSKFAIDTNATLNIPATMLNCRFADDELGSSHPSRDNAVDRIAVINAANSESIVELELPSVNYLPYQAFACTVDIGAAGNEFVVRNRSEHGSDTVKAIVEGEHEREFKYIADEEGLTASDAVDRLKWDAYVIRSQAIGNGKISPSGSYLVSPGEDAVFVMKADDENETDTITVDGEKISVTGSYTFKEVLADHEIIVSYKASAGGNSGNGGGGGGDRPDPTPNEPVVIPEGEVPAGELPDEEVEVPADEVPGGAVIDEEPIPAGELPKTGGLDAAILYGLGALLAGSGLVLRRKK